MAVLKDIEPISVFNYFEIISNIPRGSGNEKGISDYIVQFAKDRGLEVIQDEFHNVIIKKPATKGYENAKTVILQGHLDMVCEKNMDKEHDFLNDPITLKVDGDYIFADQTTLGADNGIAVAYTLALLDSSDIPHPPLEVLLTTDEEVGMQGALKLDTSQLKGKYFINLDSEEEGELLVSCAGGLKAYILMDVKYKKTEKNKAIKVFIQGLYGGHSGMEIDKNRANANKLMGRLLYDLQKDVDYDIFNINGGLKDNAIPRESYVSLMINAKDVSLLKKSIENIETGFKNEFSTSDPNIRLSIEEINNVEDVLTDNIKRKLIFLLLNIPNGIQTMSADIKDLVESSLNLGVVTMSEDSIKLIFAVRSSVQSLKYLIRDQLKEFANYLDFEFIETAEYPEWTYKKDSKLRSLFIDTYEKIYQKKPLIKALHAGLECGVFAKTIKDLDLISLGPNMYDVHTPNEKLSISSTKRTWEYILEVLKEFNNL